MTTRTLDMANVIASDVTIAGDKTLSGDITFSGDVIPSTPLSHRNLMINGAMLVAQRGTSFVTPSSGSYTLDRFSALNGTDGTFTITQDSSAPTASEAGVYFTKSLKLDVTTADTSIGASQLCWIETKNEGQDAASAGFGQSGTRYVTLSFWHKHTKTGIHSVVIKNGNQNRSYVAEYTQSTTDTWEKATITIPVDTSGTWAYDNTAGIRIVFSIAVGSTYQTTAGSWVSGNYHGSVNLVNNLDSTSNNFQITGVQLELGSVATPFEHRSYADELQRCQRYYHTILTLASPAGVLGYTRVSGSVVRGAYQLATTMRAAGTLVESHSDIVYRFNGTSNLNNNGTAPSIDIMANYGGSIDFGGFSGLPSDGQGGIIRITSGTSGAHLALSSEL